MKRLRESDADTVSKKKAKAAAAPPAQTKQLFKVSGLGGAILNYMVHNYVHTTKLANGDRDDAVFDLAALAKRLIAYKVELSFTKFAKVNLRLLGLLSLLIYNKMVVVETGSDCRAKSRRALAFLVGLLRDQCGYPNIRVKARLCQNIVLTGQYNRPISLAKLVAEFPDAERRHNFSGVIIRLQDLQRWHDNRRGSAPRHMAPDYTDDDDETEFLRRLNQTREDGEEEEDSSLDVEELMQALRETDEFEGFTYTKVTKVTFLVFKEASMICTGCNKESQAHIGFSLLYQLLDKCRV